MQTYIGTKIVQAEPMDEFTFTSMVKPLPYIVQIGSAGQSLPGYKVVYEDGYVSWSPKDVFERCYRQLTPSEAALAIQST